MNVAIDTEVVAVPEAALLEHYRRVVPVQAEQARHWKRIATRRKWLVGGLATAVIAEALAIVFIMPLIRVFPVFVFVDKFGVAQATNMISELPPDKRVASIETLIWQYLRMREQYSASEADYNYKIVSAMSADNVRTQFQRWSNPKLNDQAPAKRLGLRGVIRVYRIGGLWRSHADDYTAGIYQFQFCRVIQMESQPPIAQRFAETVRYQMVDSIPLWERLELNYAGLIVTEYPGPESESGSEPKVVQTILGDNPCAG